MIPIPKNFSDEKFGKQAFFSRRSFLEREDGAKRNENPGGSKIRFS